MHWWKQTKELTKTKGGKRGNFIIETLKRFQQLQSRWSLQGTETNTRTYSYIDIEYTNQLVVLS